MSDNMVNSAYRSMMIAKKGKTKNKDGKLKQWIDEKWLNLNALYLKNEEIPCGQKYKGQKDPTVCRPKKKVNNTTPKPLAYDLTKKQVEKAIKQKKQGKRIKWIEI